MLPIKSELKQHQKAHHKTAERTAQNLHDTTAERTRQDQGYVTIIFKALTKIFLAPPQDLFWMVASSSKGELLPNNCGQTLSPGSGMSLGISSVTLPYTE
jgi:hypothetical protein